MELITLLRIFGFIISLFIFVATMRFIIDVPDILVRIANALEEIAETKKAEEEDNEKDN